MISVSDFIHLPYTRDLTEGGIAYALRSLALGFDRIEGSPYSQLRQAVAEAAVELALRRHLAAQQVPFEVKSGRPFASPDHYDVALDGQRCELHTFFVQSREQISAIRDDPTLLLKTQALVESDENAAEGRLNSDLYLFAFLLGQVNTSPKHIQAVIEAGEPYYFVHVLPEAWRRPGTWTPLGALVLKSDSAQTERLAIGGLEAGRGMLSQPVEVPPRTRVRLEKKFFSIAYIHSQGKPEARLGIHSPVRKETYIIGPADWSNLWVYGLEILLGGYLSREDFNRRASFVRAGAQLFPYGGTRTKCLSVPICDLKPLAELFERAKKKPGDISH